MTSSLYYFPFQVSFNKNGRGAGAAVATGSLPMSRSEPVSLANLDRDCFIIPLHAVDRFLPEGVPVSRLPPHTPLPAPLFTFVLQTGYLLAILYEWYSTAF